VNKNYIQINSYKPLETSSLRKFSKIVKSNISDFNDFILKYETKNKDGEVKINTYLFEKIKS